GGGVWVSAGGGGGWPVGISRGAPAEGAAGSRGPIHSENTPRQGASASCARKKATQSANRSMAPSAWAQPPAVTGELGGDIAPSCRRYRSAQATTMSSDPKATNASAAIGP